MLDEIEHAVVLEPDDLIKEVSLLADRADISEEIVRLRSHLEQFLATAYVALAFTILLGILPMLWTNLLQAGADPAQEEPAEIAKVVAGLPGLLDQHLVHIHKGTPQDLSQPHPHGSLAGGPVTDEDQIGLPPVMRFQLR